MPVADCYGSREAGFIAHECPAGNYHITAENVIVEILDGDCRRWNRRARPAKSLSPTWTAYAMPLHPLPDR